MSTTGISPGRCECHRFQRIVGPRLMGLTPDEAAIAAAMPKAHAVFDQLARQLGDAPFFVGDSLSLADILLAPQLDFFRSTARVGSAQRKAWKPSSVAGPHDARRSMVATTWERVATMAKAA